MRGENKGKLWEGRREKIDSKRVILNYIKRKGATLPPEFPNTGICMACGKEKHVNTCGFCALCWVQFSHLRKPRVIDRKEGT
jgi:hypothetical protein